MPAAATRSSPLADLWSRFAAVPDGRRISGTVPVAIFGAMVAAAASAVTVSRHINMDYGDAMAHLTIARRIIDSKSAGFRQLGTVWLPAPHLLLMPFVQNTWLWHTGIAACIVGVGSMAVSTASIYRICARVGIGRNGRVVALVIFLANPSLLYAYTTALTEPVLIASMLACIAGLAGWALSERRLSGGELAVFAGIPAGVSVLTRYEGWALVVSGTIFVAIASLRRGDSWGRSIQFCISFAAVPVVAIGWWFAYNLATYGNPFEFLTGPYSAQAFAADFISQGTLTTKGNAGLSVWVLGWAVIESSGLFPIVLGLVGLVAMTIYWGISTRALVIWLAVTSLAFLIVTLVGGQSIMVNDHSLPTGWYNSRYALSVSPAFALGGAWIVNAIPARSWRGLAMALCIAGVAAQCLWWSQDLNRRSAVLAEAHQGHGLQLKVKETSRWLGRNYDGGSILMDESAPDLAVAPIIGVPLSDVFNRSSGPLFAKACANPSRYAKWVLMHRADVRFVATKAGIDRVSKALLGDPQFLAQYRLVHANGNFGVYERIGGAS